MGAGLVIDDGGSTRIKWMGRESEEAITGKMRTIMTVVESNDRKQSTQEIVEEKDPYSQIRIVWQDRFGHPTEIYPKPFNFIKISSELQQFVEVQNTGKGLVVQLYGGIIEPIVEARQHELRRRYIVSNSGRILKVEVDGDPVFDINVISKGDPQFVIYTSVVLT